MRTLAWYLKQLIPHTYWTQVGKTDGSTEFVIWRMWLGRCSNVIRVPGPHIHTIPLT